MTELPVALQAWSAWPQFILWTREMRNGKLAKVPIDHRTLRPGSVTNPAIYMSAQEAFYKASLYGDAYGVGFCFTEKDPFFFIDIDSCLEGDHVSAFAQSIMGSFPGVAMEVSQSDNGLHLLGKYSSLIDHSNKNAAHNFELYTSNRYAALTFDRMTGSIDTDSTVPLANLITKYFPPKAKVISQEWTDMPVAEWDGIEDDAELIKQALKSKSAREAFGSGAGFKALWEKDVEILAKAYPDKHGDREYDYSSADAALASHLAFWTGNNCLRMWNLMFRSALRRPKWDQRPDYVQTTILGACSIQKQWYKARVQIESLPVGTPGQISDPKLRVGYQWLTPEMQLDHFEGCCYIQDQHAVFIPSGDILKPDQFNVAYGAYSFQMDDTGKKDTKKAFEAFTQSQGATFPKAQGACFKPKEEPGKIIEYEGRTFVNTYVPIKTRRIEGDSAPFQNLLAKQLPNEHDRKILLSYMAACIQYPGYKFQWAPLIQGTEGNGKTLLTLCVSKAIGEGHCHMPPAHELAEKFNAWLFDKLFIGVEEMHVPEGKLGTIEVLKPMLVNPRLAMRAMHQSQVMKDNVANFILNSNRRDAVPKHKNDRRFCVFFTAQQSVDDLTRDGMDGDYFPKLYEWLNADGYAIVAQYLQTYPIPDELNPATKCHRAPETSTTHEAIEASLGRAEQEVLEAVAEGRYGFRGDWISSSPLNTLFEEKNLTSAVPPNKRRDMLKTLRYDWHPTLNKGRATQFIHMDGGKSQSCIFVMVTHREILSFRPQL